MFMLTISGVVMMVMMFLLFMFVEEMKAKSFYISCVIFLVSAVTFSINAFIFLASMPGNGF